MTKDTQPRIPPCWQEVIGGEFGLDYMKKLKTFLQAARNSGQRVFPRGRHIFNALNTTGFNDVRVVILGQDPYHGAGQAHGLSFSVPKGVRPPPSLQNIYKEIERDYSRKMPAHGELTGWAQQGVLLLNATLTVAEGMAGSHQNQGWERFTDSIIRAVNDRHEHIVFMLWGAYAQKKGGFIDRQKHLVLRAPHPSPLSAHRGFIGCGHFTAANDYLIRHGRAAIDWYNLP